jgi:hypothetical protein
MALAKLMLWLRIENLTTQFLKTTEAMVSDISLRLAKHRGNLIQRIAFDKVKPECLSLILRKAAEDSLQIQRCELLFKGDPLRLGPLREQTPDSSRRSVYDRRPT